jgi:S-layer homology domain
MKRCHPVLFVLVILCGLLLAVAAPAWAFPDVPADHPYVVAINDLASEGIISGHANGNFGPDEPVARCQFAKMIVNTLGLSHTDPSMPFVDVGPGDLPEFVAAAARSGITKGTNEAGTLFSPWGNITRAQMVTMVVRAAQNLEPGTLAVAPDGYLSPWKDFSPVHAAFASTADYNGLFNLMQSAFLRDAWQNATRGEVAQVLWNLKAFQRQTKPADEMITGEELPLDEAPPSLVSAIMSLNTVDPDQPVNWIRRIHVEHPVNASVQLTFYLALGFDYYWAFADGDGWVVRSVTAQLASFAMAPETDVLYTFQGNPDGGGWVPLDWELGGQYIQVASESLAQYRIRVAPLIAAFESSHGEGGYLYLWYAGLRDLLRQSVRASFFDPTLAQRQQWLQISYQWAYGQGPAIERLADVLWDWHY